MNSSLQGGLEAKDRTFICFTSSEVELLLTLSRRVRELSREEALVHPEQLELLVKGFDLLFLEGKVAIWRSVVEGEAGGQ